ncbi:MAG: serine/threonine protein kinase [Candidatus Sericytochromatia bacterium]
MKSGELLHERYEIGARLGHGGMAHTHLALDRRTDQEVVVKELCLSGLDSWKIYELFEREAQTLGQLRHERIPALVEFFRIEAEEDLRLYIVTERMAGVSLAQKLESGLRLSESEVIDIARQILGILVYLQSLSPPVVHRDIKPSNLLLDGGKVFLVDFGAVQAAGASGGSTVVGTFGYMAPEQFSGRAIPASDLYSLGATVVHLLAGMSPADMSFDDMRLRFRPHLGCSEALAAWLERLLEPAAEKRLQSAAAALAALEAIASGETLAAQDTALSLATSGPPGTRVSVDRKKERLFIEVSPLSIKNPQATLYLISLALSGFITIAFSFEIMELAWFLFLFVLPLSLAGLGFTAWILSFFARQTLVLMTPNHVQIETHYGGFQSREHRIVYKDLSGIRLQKAGFPLHGIQALVLEENGTRRYGFGHLLSNSEKIWLQQEMFTYLAGHCQPEQFARLSQEADLLPPGT